MDWFLYNRDQVIQFFGLHSSILAKFLGKFQLTLQIFIFGENRRGFFHKDLVYALDAMDEIFEKLATI